MFRLRRGPRMEVSASEPLRTARKLDLLYAEPWEAAEGLRGRR